MTIIITTIKCTHDDYYSWNHIIRMMINILVVIDIRGIIIVLINMFNLILLVVINIHDN